MAPRKRASGSIGIDSIPAYLLQNPDYGEYYSGVDEINKQTINEISAKDAKRKQNIIDELAGIYEQKKAENPAIRPDELLPDIQNIYGKYGLSETALKLGKDDFSADIANATNLGNLAQKSQSTAEAINAGRLPGLDLNELGTKYEKAGSDIYKIDGKGNAKLVVQGREREGRARYINKFNELGQATVVDMTDLDSISNANAQGFVHNQKPDEFDNLLTGKLKGKGSKGENRAGSESPQTFLGTPLKSSKSETTVKYIRRKNPQGPTQQSGRQIRE